MASGTEPGLLRGAEQAGPAPKLAIPFNGSLRLSACRANLELNGPHRFLQVGDRTGYQPLSLNTRLKIGTDLHCQSTGSIVLKVCPLETLASAAAMQDFISKEPYAQ